MSSPAVWSLQDAKNRFSAVVDAAQRGEPQLVTRRGKPAVVVVDAETFESLKSGRQRRWPTLVDALLDMPRSEEGLQIPRAPWRDREVDL
ncbi:MAG TPA: type II toxin-antitoxin system Phd/YefM family antitoxin [Geminicoccaceae bacterium]|nr:type II toxin-antitoxin system Phd/YefM family antitoxin [Geminicoccaceae bacterium]